MRFFLLFLVVASVSALSEPIADFAPDQVGNVWKYRVYSSEAELGIFGRVYLTRTFKLVRSEITTKYKRIIFDIIDSGIDSTSYMYFQPHAIDTNYFDTCFEFGDSIQDTSQDLFSIDFIPFYKHHIIDSDTEGMEKILYKNDSVFEFLPSTFYDYLSYVQNIGLDSLFSISHGNTTYTLSVKLISFTPAPTSITQSPKKLNPIQTTRRNFPSAYIYDLQGRRFRYQGLSSLPPGLMINRGVNYLQVK